MREILFRGKRADNGEWVEGHYGVKGKETDAEEHFIIKSKTMTTNSLKSQFAEVEVDPETVGQFTGLTDKNGTKIFEGDIVDILTENEEIGVVEYDDGGFEVKADGFTVDFHSNINGTSSEVIGNIHDNPELVGC